MEKPLQITFRNMKPSGAIKRDIEEKAAALEAVSSHLISCHVVMEVPHQHKRHGQHYRCRIEMEVPRHKLVAGRSPDQRDAHEDASIAIRDAFRAARRELQALERRRRHRGKTHAAPPHAVVSRLFPNEGNGFLTTADGREIFFHKNSVIGDFDDLVLGAEVRFAEEQGEKGPQASTVTPVGKSGHSPMARSAH